MKALANLFRDLANQINQPTSLISLSAPKQDSDLALACFSLASDQPVNEVANRLSQQLNHPALKKVQVSGGYVNLYLESTYLAEQLFATGNQDLIDPPTTNQPVLIEYCSVNLAKPLSVGHLRNLLLGRALVNLHRHFGFGVITDNHLGDWGTVFGIWVVGFLQFSSNEALEAGGNRELGRVYVKMRQALKDEAKKGQDHYRHQVQSWLLKLEAGDSQAWEYHRRFSAVSLADLKQVLDLFKIQFDYNLGESFYQQQAKHLVDELIESKLAQRQDDNSVIVDLQSVGIKTPLLVQKSNGANLYATSDIATIKYRQTEFNPQRVIYVVANDQQFYFKQLLAFNQLANYTQAELIHYNYGLIEEKKASGRQKMSSRQKAIYLTDVIDAAHQATKKLIKPGLSSANQTKIALGALAFFEFSHNYKHNILFDWDRIFSLKSMSGPYVQYTTVRLRAILAKASPTSLKPQFGDYDWQPEHPILLKLLSYPDVLDESLQMLDLSKIAYHIWQLCQLLNRYYETTTVLVANDNLKNNRLWLIDQAVNQIQAAFEHFRD